MNLDLREIPAVYMNLKQHTEKNENMQKILQRELPKQCQMN